MTSFELITEHGRIVAAIIQAGTSNAQLNSIYAILPPRAMLSMELTSRWQVAAVAADPDWESAQLRRIPMTKPKTTIKLAFL